MTIDRNIIVLVAVLAGCGARTGLVVVPADAARPDAAIAIDGDASADAGPIDGGHDAAAPRCDFGVIVGTVDGSFVPWNDGAPIPAGHYRIRYVDGCMKYSGAQDWTVNAYAAGPYAYWITAPTRGGQLAVAPGTVGFMPGSAFATFDECVAANAADPIVELDFAGGVLGVELEDSPYTDNVAGEGGRNPSWQLSSCP